MNAAPISMNAPSTGIPSGSGSTQAADAQGTPGFAQVLSEKQSAASAPKSGAPGTNPALRAPANSATPGHSQKSTGEASRANPTTNPPPKSPASDGTNAAAPKKTDAKEKPGCPSDPNQAAATVAATAASLAMLSLLPPAQPIPVISVDTKSSGSPDSATTAPSATPPQPTQASATAAPNALPNLPLPVLLGPGASQLPAATNTASSASAPPATTSKTPTAAQNMPSAQTLTAASTQAPVSNAGGAQSAAAQSVFSATAVQQASVPAPVPSATPAPITNSDNASGKPQPVAHAEHKQAIAEILHNLIPEAGKAPTDATPSPRTSGENALAPGPSKSTATESAPAASAVAGLATKTDIHVSVRTEPAASTPAPPSTANASEKNANHSADTPNNNEFANSDSGTADNAPPNGKAHGFSIGTDSSQTNLQSAALDSSNPISPAALGVTPMPATGKDSGSVAKPAATADAENSNAAPSDASDVKPQTLDSKLVNMAQLTGNNSHSEVRIAMQADQLGQVELHATLNGQQVGAAIIVEKKEAHVAMAVELPSLQQALEDKHLRVSEVILTQSTLHSTAGDAGNGGNAPAEQRRGQAGTQYRQAGQDSRYVSTPSGILESTGVFDDHGRLSVRA